MSLFTSVDNQQMLWGLVTKTKRFSVHFENPSTMQGWFRDIIQNFHENNNEPYNMVQLKHMNTSVIQFMIKDVKQIQTTSGLEKMVQEPYEPQQQSQQQPPTHEYDVQSQQKENTTTNDYEQRQKEYYSLLEPQKPKTVDFSETPDETVTMDMYEKRQSQYEQNINIPNPVIEENKKMLETIATMQSTIVTMQEGITELRATMDGYTREIISNQVSEVVEGIIEKI